MKRPSNLPEATLTTEVLIGSLTESLGAAFRECLEVLQAERRGERPFESLQGRERELAWRAWRSEIERAKATVSRHSDELLRTLEGLGAVKRYDMTSFSGTRWLFLTAPLCASLVEELVSAAGNWHYSANAGGYYFGKAPAAAALRHLNRPTPRVS